jgi:mono/diheme cytochrome c family protein
MYKFAAWLSTLMVLAITGCSAGRSEPPPPAADDDSGPDTGARIYSGNCLACHQQDARGLAGVYPSLVASPVLLGDPQELALWVIEGRRPAGMPAGRYSTVMPRFGWMKAQDAAALFTYMRSQFGNSAPPVDAATVARALAQ